LENGVRNVSIWARLLGLDDAVVEGTPEVFDLAVGLGPVGPGELRGDPGLGEVVVSGAGAVGGPVVG
jgi:hypothetical protein